jgi:hypothetical protein
MNKRSGNEFKKWSEREDTWLARRYDYDVDFEVGDMTTTVYPVGGGMEDWAYGAGWDRAKDATLSKCTPQTYLLSEKENKVSFKDSAHIRTAIYLIETSMNKLPRDYTLGCRYEQRSTNRTHISVL